MQCTEELTQEAVSAALERRGFSLASFEDQP